ISSSASWAEYRSSATTKATSWPWKRTLSVARTAWVSPAIVGIQANPCASRSFPVITARTFGCSSAAETSMSFILAWAKGLLRIAEWSIPGSCRSSTYLPLPRTKRASSLRGILSPKVCPCLVSTAITASPPPAWARRACQERGRSHDHTRSAKPALQSVLLAEPLLQEAEVGAAGDALDRGHVVPVGPDREHRAGLDGLTVEVHRARPAVGGVAPPVGPGEPQGVPDEVDEQEARLHVGLPRLPVYVHLYPHGATLSTVSHTVLGAPGAAHGLPQGPHYQHPHQIPLVLRRAPGVIQRVALLRRPFPGSFVELLARLLSLEYLLGLPGPERGGAHAAHPTARVLYLLPTHPHRDPQGRRGVVAGPPLHLEVGASLGRPRDPGLREDLVRLDGRLERPHGQVLDGDGPLSTRSAHHDLGPERDEGRREVLRWVRVGEGAADRAHIPHQRVGDKFLRVREQRVPLPHHRGLQEVPVAGEGPDPQRPLVLPDVAELAVQLVYVYEHLREGQPQLHHRDQAVPPGQKAGLRPVPLQEFDCFLDRGGNLVVELRGYLQRRLLSLRLARGPRPGLLEPGRVYAGQYNKTHNAFIPSVRDLRPQREESEAVSLVSLVSLGPAAWMGPERSARRPPE